MCYLFTLPGHGLQLARGLARMNFIVKSVLASFKGCVGFRCALFIFIYQGAVPVM